MKYRRLLFLIPLLICCGWTSNYDLEYNGKVFKETLTYNFEDNIYNLAKQYENIEEGEFFEVEIISDDIYASPKKIYKKEFSEDGRVVTLTANYNFNELMESYQLTSCFENYNFKKTSGNYDITLSGEYDCDEFETLTLTTNSNNMVEHNATRSSNYNGKISYIWNVKNNADIQFSLKDKSNIYDFFIYVIPILLVLSILVLIIFIKHKKANS